jgi:hypothetical protein
VTTARVSWYSGEKHELLTGEGVSVGYGFGVFVLEGEEG